MEHLIDARRPKVQLATVVEIGVLKVIVAGQVQFPFVLVEAIDGRLFARLRQRDELLHLIPLPGFQRVLDRRTRERKKLDFRTLKKTF